MTRRSQKGQPTIAELRDRMHLIIGFLENVQDFPVAHQMREIIDAEAAKGNLRGLRMACRDVEAMAETLEPHEREGLEALLESRLGVDKEAERAELAKWAEAVLQRGTIRSEKERRKLEDYVETLMATGGDTAQIDAINALLRSS